MNKWYIIAVTALIVITFAAGSPGAHAAAASSVVEIKAAALNVRTGPGPEHDIVNMVSRGAHTTLMARQGEWLKVKLPWGSVGWVFGGKEHTASHPVKETLRTTAPALNVRSGPGTKYAPIAELPLGTKVSVLQTREGWHRIVLKSGKTGWIFAGYTESPTAAANPAPDRNAPARATSTPTSRALQGKTIVVDAGHGGHDPGAVGIVHNLTEKLVNLDTALKLTKLLEGAGARVLLPRQTDVFIQLGQRVAIANNARADIFVSIHANAHNNRSIGGTETYYNSSYRPADSRRLASLVQQELVKELTLRDIGIKEGSFYVIRHTTMPSILLEMGFLSNAHEETLLNQPSFRQRSAEAVFRGILRYFQ
jgi:N-acetylmuramoyl-L-alanine amidase